MGLVAIRMTEARLVMADNRVVPVAKIERAVRAKLCIHGTEAAAGGLEQWRQVFEGEPGAVVPDSQGPQSIVDVTANDEHALPRVGKVRGADNVAAARLAAVAVFPNQRRRIITV